MGVFRFHGGDNIIADIISWTCPVCDVTIRMPSNGFPVHCICGLTQYRNPPGLGDRTAAILAKVGMTEEKYLAIKRRLGLKGKCNCPERQQALNRITFRRTDTPIPG